MFIRVLNYSYAAEFPYNFFNKNRTGFDSFLTTCDQTSGFSEQSYNCKKLTGSLT